MTQAPEKYFIRFSNAQDTQNLFKFYDAHKHKNVFERDHDVVKKMIDEGSVILLENAKGDIVASSITYPYLVKDKNGIEEVKWQELGTTRIVLNGFPGVLNTLATLQMLRTFLVEPPEDRFICQVDTTPVQNAVQKLGWRPMTAPQELLDAKAKLLGKGHLQAHRENWFQVGMEALPLFAKNMAAVIDNPILTNAKTGEQIEIDFSKSTFVKLFTPEIKRLAGEDFGNVEKPDMKESMKTRQRKWLRDFFR